MTFIARATLHERGQVTIPSKVRSLLGLRPGEGLLIFADEGEIVIRPEVASPLDRAGMLGRDDGTERVKDLVARYEEG